MLNKKWVTWLLILLIALLPLPAIVQYLQTFIVRNAVVTAYRFEVTAPIGGVVETLTVSPGSIPGAGPALVLGNRRVPLAEIESLEARYLENQRYHGFLGKELSELEARLDESQSLFSSYRTMIQKDLGQAIAILKARQAGETARLKEASQIRMRVIPLVQTSVVTQEENDRIEADFREAQALLNVTRLEQDQIEYRRQMLEQNLFPSSFSDGVLQVQNRINNLEMKIFDFKRRIHFAGINLATDAVKIHALREDMEHRSAKAVVVVPDTAVIWDVDVRIGMEVSKGDRILSYIDRSQLMVDVAMDDATIALILPGHPARIRLFGSNRFINGTVISVLGSGAQWPDHSFAAGVKGKSVRDGRVLVQIDDPQLQGDVKRFCGVGRTAYAEFEGIGLLEQYFGTFLR